MPCSAAVQVRRLLGSGAGSVRKALLVGVMLQLFQQLAGINTVIYYSARILQMSGISNSVWKKRRSFHLNCKNIYDFCAGEHHPVDLLRCEPHQLSGLLHRAVPGDGQLQLLLLTPLLQVDRVGRRKLTLLSYLGIVLSLLLLGIGFTLAEVRSPAVTVQVSSSVLQCWY